MKINSVYSNNPSFKAVLTPIAQAFVSEAFDDVLQNGTKNQIRDAALYYSEIHSIGTARGWKLHAGRMGVEEGVPCTVAHEDFYILKRPDKYDKVILKTTSKEPMSSFDKLRNLALDLTLRAKERPKMTKEESQKEVEKLSKVLKEQNVQGISFTLDVDA